MKIRIGFVSNSSSSSFLIRGGVNIPVNKVKLTSKQIAALASNRPELQEFLSKGDIYLTQYIPDTSEANEQIHKLDSQDARVYDFGSWDGPYEQDTYTCLYVDEEDSVWIRDSDLGAGGCKHNDLEDLGNGIKWCKDCGALFYHGEKWVPRMRTEGVSNES